MKKLLVAFAVIGVSACILGGCATKNPPNNTTETDNYDALNQMLDANYSKLELTVTDTFDEDTYLVSKYTIVYAEKFVSVNYSVEQFVEISLDNPSSSVKTTLSGVAVIKDGEITFQGQEIEISSNIVKPNLTFKGEYFNNAQLTDNSLSAGVKNVEGFIGSEVVCSGMTVEAEFMEVFNDIKINYTSESGSQVEYYYDFTL